MRKKKNREVLGRHIRDDLFELKNNYKKLKQLTGKQITGLEDQEIIKALNEILIDSILQIYTDFDKKTTQKLSDSQSFTFSGLYQFYKTSNDKSMKGMNKRCFEWYQQAKNLGESRRENPEKIINAVHKIVKKYANLYIDLLSYPLIESLYKFQQKENKILSTPDTRISNHFKDKGIDRYSIKTLDKNRAFNDLIVELVNYLNQYSHGGCLDNDCVEIHNTTFKLVHLILNIYFPMIFDLSVDGIKKRYQRLS